MFNLSKQLVDFKVIFSTFQNPAQSIKPQIKQVNDNYIVQKVSKDGFELGYIHVGDKTKPCLVFIHGSPGSLFGWSHYLCDEQLLTHFQMISFDRPGYVYSDYGQARTSLAEQARAVQLILQDLQIEQPVFIVGHSYGGPVAVKFAQLYPNCVKSIFLVSSSIDPDLEEVKSIQRIGRWKLIKSLIPRELIVCNEEILLLKDELIKIDFDLITCDVTIIHGKDDVHVPVGNVDYMLEKFIKASLVKSNVHEDVNHFIPWQYSELIKKPLLELINL